MKERIHKDIKNALKNKQILELSTIRMMLAEIERKEKEKGLPVDTETANRIFQSMVRKRKEAAELFFKGGRQELAEKEQQEIKINENYLPKQLSEEKLREHVKSVILKLGVKDPGEMGRVMGVVMKDVSGKADGSMVRRIVCDELGKIDS